MYNYKGKVITTTDALTMMPFVAPICFEKGHHRILCNMNLLAYFFFFTAINMTNLKSTKRKHQTHSRYMYYFVVTRKSVNTDCVQFATSIELGFLTRDKSMILHTRIIFSTHKDSETCGELDHFLGFITLCTCMLQTSCILPPRSVLLSAPSVVIKRTELLKVESFSSKFAS